MGKKHSVINKAPVNVCQFCGGNLKHKKMLGIDTYVCRDCGEIFDVDELGLISRDPNTKESTILQMEWLIQKISKI